MMMIDTRRFNILLKVLRRVEKDPNKPFTLENWQQDAIGYLVSSPEGKKEGLSLEEMTDWYSDEPIDTVVFGEYCGWGAVMDFFNIEFYEAKSLFSPEYYPKDYSLQDVIVRIENFIEDKR